MHNFTTDDLLVHLYGDEPLGNNPELFSSSLQQSWALQQKLDVFQESINCLNDIPLLQPRNASLEAILQYADLAIHAS